MSSVLSVGGAKSSNVVFTCVRVNVHISSSEAKIPDVGVTLIWAHVAMQLVRPSSVFRMYRNFEPSTVDRHSDCHSQLAHFGIGEVVTLFDQSSKICSAWPRARCQVPVTRWFRLSLSGLKGHVPDVQLRFGLGACTCRIRADINMRTQPVFLFEL